MKDTTTDADFQNTNVIFLGKGSIVGKERILQVKQPPVAPPQLHTPPPYILAPHRRALGRKITLSQLRALLAVISAGSVGLAARQLKVTQSAVSQAIITLERALELPLLTRTREGVVPTALASEVLKYADIALMAVESIESFASIAAQKQDVPLRIACIQSAVAGLLPGCCRRFRKLYPNVKLSIFEGNHLEVGEWVLDGVADIGISSIVPEGLRAGNIRQEELVVIARRGHEAIRRVVVSPHDLDNEVLVTTGPGCASILKNIFGGSEERPRRKIHAQGISTALEMVREGLGVTILPEIVLPSLNTLDLRFRRLEPRAFRQLFLVSVPEPANGELISAFHGISKEESCKAL